MKQRKVVIQRILQKKSGDEKIDAQINYLLGRALKGNRGRCWDCKVRKSPPVQKEGNWLYTCTFLFEKTSGREGTEEKQWGEIVKYMGDAGLTQRFGSNPWQLVDKESDLPKVRAEISSGYEKVTARTMMVKDYGKIGTNLDHHFDHIYDRDEHIGIIHSAIIAAVESDFRNRFHCVLYGAPGCGKSELLIAVGNMLGEENEAYLKFDATSTTEAGAQKLLLESDYVPPVLIVEEIEKTDEKSLRWLLGLLDQRAEIRKTNFNIGNRAKNVKMLCLATVNNMDLFSKVMSGALASRFANEIQCPRPDRNLLQKILEREVKKVNGNFRWIEPALKYCYDENKIDDPRKIVPVCLCGRNKLLTGDYQKMLNATRPKKP